MDLMQWNWWLNSGGGGSPTIEDYFGDSLIAWLRASNTYQNFSGQLFGATESPGSYAVNDGDLVTTSYTGGKGGLLTNSTIAISPSLITNSGRSMVRFSGSTKWAEFADSTKKVFKIFHKVQPTFSILGWIKKNGGDGTLQYICSSNNSTSSQIGIQLTIDTSNRLNVQLSAGGGNWIINQTSASSLITVARGLVPFAVVVNGTTGHIRIGSDVVAMTVSAVNGTTSDATNSLRIGTRQTVGGYLTADLGDLTFVNYAITDDDWDFFINWNEDRDRYAWVAEYSNFRTDQNVFSDTALTTPIANGEGIAGWKSATPYPGGDPLRSLIQSNAANRPVWTAADSEINNKPNATWYGDANPYPGINSNLVSTNGAFLLRQFVIFTRYFVVRNNRLVTPGGGHCFSGISAGYCAIGTGGGTWHMSSNEIATQIVLVNPPPEYNIISITVNMIDGTSTYMGSDGVLYTSTVTNDNLIEMNQMGFTWKPAAENWWWHGNYPFDQLFIGEHTTAQRLAIINSLKAEYGIN